jgi:hypothetical protein
MNTLELKSSIHKTVESIQNEELLQTVYDFLKSKQMNKSGEIWNSLTEEQKNEVRITYEESEDENNLKVVDELFK